MKPYIFFFFCFLLFNSCCANTQKNDRKLAIEKQVESVNTYFDACYKNFNEDSIHLAMDLIDKSILLDTTFLLAYQTKIKYLINEKSYEEALAVFDLIFKRNLEVNNPIIFVNRAILYEKMGDVDRANNDYARAIPLYDTWLEQNSDDYNALKIRTILIYLSNGKEEGIKACKELLTKPLTEMEIQDVKMLIEHISINNREDVIHSM